MKVEKTLATCSATEFLVQTNKIRKAVEKWLTETDIASFRKKAPKPPELPEIPDDEGEAEKVVKLREKLQSEYEERRRATVKASISAILDSILEEHPEDTLELLALICFIDPKDVDKVRGIELLNGAVETLSDDEVLRFFTSLADLVQTLTSD